MVDTNQLIEIRWHGRGGQGVVTSTELVAQAAISEDKYAQAFPSFGPERRGAPVTAFVRIDNIKPIRIRSEIREPDIMVILDPTLLKIASVVSGLKENGILVINTTAQIEQLRKELNHNFSLAVLDATKIAREILGVPIANTTMIGALMRAKGMVQLSSFVEPLKNRFGRLADKNIKAMKKAYEETALTG
jgi:pyruvate ferredoxin oxidoreductase gamma subunit